jgi:hypothetical protein
VPRSLSFQPGDKHAGSRCGVEARSRPLWLAPTPTAAQWVPGRSEPGEGFAPFSAVRLVQAIAIDDQRLGELIELVEVLLCGPSELDAGASHEIPYPARRHDLIESS